MSNLAGLGARADCIELGYGLAMWVPEILASIPEILIT